ncbi:MAG TPA: hypothetical protein VMU57_01665, partial [Edaphobacter sp.]|uniref:hypothetical protein n=1 Tax=Edaphobacter sp. TaxID=1934404 RepID=UPI002D055BDB
MNLNQSIKDRGHTQSAGAPRKGAEAAVRYAFAGSAAGSGAGGGGISGSSSTISSPERRSRP